MQNKTALITITVLLLILLTGIWYFSSKKSANQVEEAPRTAQESHEVCPDTKVYKSLEEALAAGDKACILDLSSQNLKEVPQGISKLTKLNSLYLGGNQLTSLSPEVFQLKELIRLDAPSTQISSLPPEIGNLTNLQILNLTNNKLTSIPAEIGKLENLTDLLLSGNINPKKNQAADDPKVDSLKTLPIEVANLHRLSTLNLQGNHVPTAEQLKINGYFPNITVTYDLPVTVGETKFTSVTPSAK